VLVNCCGRGDKDMITVAKVRERGRERMPWVCARVVLAVHVKWALVHVSNRCLFARAHTC
jgi:hypothetical protein